MINGIIGVATFGIFILMLVGTYHIREAQSESNQTLRQQKNIIKFHHDCTTLNGSLWRCDLEGDTTCYVFQSAAGAAMSCLK